MELPKELQEQTKDLPSPSGKAKQSLALLGDWWSIFGQTYKDDPTAELAAGFRKVLEPLFSKPELLDEAITEAVRRSPRFRPSAGLVYEIAEGIMASRQTGNRPKYLDEPKLSAEEREAQFNELSADPAYQELRKRIAKSGT